MACAVEHSADLLSAIAADSDFDPSAAAERGNSSAHAMAFRSPR